MTASVIIRVKNEVRNLAKLLHLLQQQTFQDFEIIIVNDGSTDGSAEIVFEHFKPERAAVVSLDKPFSYAYASNVGAEHANGTYLVYVSAHSFPISNTWLGDGLNHFTSNKVAGVFALPLAHTNTNIIEKLFINVPTLLWHSSLKVYTRPRLGVMGATNAIFRKDLWRAYHFNEDFVIGGEDYDWACHFLALGYVAVQDSKFRVQHSHHLGLVGLISQGFKYQRMMKPSRA